jgi:transcriptional regulator with PAS, ATPase and Fis domain
LFELACGGTILLDEVENLNLQMQSKLLRVLDEKKFRRVGGTEDIEVYFQLISTFNVEVAELFKADLFRKDFYFRIASVEEVIPPLRERPEDILVFADYFLKELTKRHGRKFTLTKESRILLLNYPWPGNIRELKNTLIAAAKRTRRAKLGVEDFERLLRDTTAFDLKQDSLRSLAEVEKQHLQRVLQETGYKIAKTAHILGIAENTLRAKMKKYELKRQVNSE